MKEKSRMRLEERKSKRGVEGEGWRETQRKRVREGETGVASQAEKAVSLYKRSPLSDQYERASLTLPLSPSLSLHFPLHVSLSFVFALRIIHYHIRNCYCFFFLHVRLALIYFYTQPSACVYSPSQRGLVHINDCVVLSLNEYLLTRRFFRGWEYHQ